jgi:hypothetical protein
MQPKKIEARSGGNHLSLANASECREGGYTADSSAAQQISRMTDDLAAIADWKDELQRKIRLAQLKFELVDCFDAETLEALEAEVRDFKEVCARLCETMAADGDRNSERQAA